MFSIARLIRLAINPVRSPTRNANDHFKKTYCKTWILDLLLQSCLKRSFSLILHEKEKEDRLLSKLNEMFWDSQV